MKIFQRPKIFGILNITPDSFSDGGLFLEKKNALKQAQKLIDDGADFLDIGAESTKPNATGITHQEEWKRIEHILPHLLQKFPGKISLDSRHSETIKKFCQLTSKQFPMINKALVPLPWGEARRGVPIINSVTGFQDPKIIEIAAKYNAIAIINHFPGKTPAEVHTKNIDSIHQIQDELLKKAEFLIKSGINKKNIILDPGIGFGKTNKLNEKLLEFKKFSENFPVFIGFSKKRFLGKNRTEKEVNQKAAQIAIKAKSEFLRMHNPKWCKTQSNLI